MSERGSISEVYDSLLCDDPEIATPPDTQTAGKANHVNEHILVALLHSEIWLS